MSIVAGSVWFCFFVSRLNNFTSKVSNLLLPFGTEGAEGFKQTQPLRYQINMSMMIFNDLSVYLVVVAFGTWKELIRDTQGL